MGAIRDAITATLADDSLTAQQKKKRIARIRAYAVQQAITSLPISLTVRDRLVITVHSATIDRDNLRCTVSATLDGSALDLGDGNFVFVNPPYLVPDPNGEIETASGARLSERPLVALRQIITDAVIDYARRRGITA